MASNGTGTTSVGLMGLPHFRSSRISMEMHEPVYTNLFTVEIVLPPKLSAAYGSSGKDIDGDKLLLLESIKKVSGLKTNSMPQTVQQHYKFAERTFAGSGPESTSMEISFDINVNLRGSGEGMPDMYNVKLLRSWNDLIWDPLTGRQGLKVDYVAPQVVVTLHDKAHNPFWQWTLYNVFPTKGIQNPDLDFSQKTNIYSISGYSLKCDYWDEVML